MDEGECFRQQSALPGNYTSGHRGMLTWRDVFLMGLTAAEANLVLLPFDLQGEKKHKNESVAHSRQDTLPVSGPTCVRCSFLSAVFLPTCYLTCRRS